MGNSLLLVLSSLTLLSRREAKVTSMAKAISRYVRLSPKRARLVADLVRGKQVSEARSILSFASTKASRAILKTLVSAAANAETQENVKADNLVLISIQIDEATKLKRASTANKGRSRPILKPTVHISIVVSVVESKEV